MYQCEHLFSAFRFQFAYNTRKGVFALSSLHTPLVMLIYGSGNDQISFGRFSHECSGRGLR